MLALPRPQHELNIELNHKPDAEIRMGTNRADLNSIAKEVRVIEMIVIANQGTGIENIIRS